MVPHDDTSGWLADYRPVEVDLSTLAQFAKALRDEVDLNFRPHAARLIDALDPGADPFESRDGFFELMAAWNQYGFCRDRAIQLLVAYANATEQLATAADLVAQRYRDTDALAAAQLSDIEKAFATATQSGTTDA